MKPDRRLWNLLGPVHGALALTVGLGVLVGIVAAAQAWGLSRAISRAFLGGDTLRQILPLLGGLAGLALLRAGLVWGSEIAANAVAARAKQDLRLRLVEHLTGLGPAYASGERTGELVNTAVEGVEALDAYFRQFLPAVALAALVPLVLFCLVTPLEWVSGLVLLATAPLLPLFLILIGNLAEGLTRRQWKTLSRMSAHFLDVLQGLTTLKLFGRSRQQAAEIARISGEFRLATMGVLRVAFLSALVLELVATLGTAVVAVQVGLRLLAGHLEFDQAFFVLVLAPEFYLPLRSLGARFHAGTAGVAAAERMFHILEAPPASMVGDVQNALTCHSERSEESPPGPVLTPTAGLEVARGTGHLPAGRPSEGPPGDLRLSTARLAFVDVHFSYAGGTRHALNGLSFEVAAGESVALVGPSGAGKSTVAALLLRFLEPQGGAILVGGAPLAALEPAVWRRHVAWVPQNPTLFFGTAAENIRLGRPDALPDEVVWAARQAQAHGLIEALPQGYDTLLGERGARLSAGEAQRIALARAFLKDAPLLVLDEATANLDPETESHIQAALERLLVGRTALILAHRLSTVRRAGRILMLEDGRLVQSGTHEELSRQDGLYRRLVAAYGGRA